MISSIVLAIVFKKGAEHGLQMIMRTLEDQEFSNFSFHGELQSRGFGRSPDEDGIHGFYYRDDGVLLWDALEKYSKSRLDLRWRGQV